MRPTAITFLSLCACAALLGACGSDDGTTTAATDTTAPSASTGGDLVAIAEATASCLQDEGFGQAIPADIFVTETGEAVPPEDGYSVLAVDGAGMDIQVMIFSDPALADQYTKDASSNDQITRDAVAGGQVVVESGFRAENGTDFEPPADEETVATVESCVSGAGL